MTFLMLLVFHFRDNYVEVTKLLVEPAFICITLRRQRVDIAKITPLLINIGVAFGNHDARLYDLLRTVVILVCLTVPAILDQPRLIITASRLNGFPVS